MTSGIAKIHAELLLEAWCDLAEGPIWDAENAELIWVDILRAQVHRYRALDSSHTATATPSAVGSVALRSDGGLILALADGFWVSNHDLTCTRPIALVEDDLPHTRFNDGKCDSAGRFWAGTMAHDQRPAGGALYRLGHNGRVRRMVPNVACSNGLGWSPDDRTFYFIDSPTRTVDAFDYDAPTGSISRRRPLITIPESQPGVPDGLAVDTDGGIWVAIWDGWAVHRYTADGCLDAAVPLPVARVTSCAFGGADLSELYITSARNGLTSKQLARQPLAGAIFRAHPGRTGVTVGTFGAAI
jgi:sugar lactone lactonase YvrE